MCVQQDHGCPIQILATDRHPSVSKIMRETYPHIKHEYDLWHIVKGIKKKLLASKIVELTPWVWSVANQLWYCAATCDGNAENLKEKWISLLHHVTDMHEWACGESIMQCEHPPYPEEEASKRPWLDNESKAFCTLQKVVLNKRLLNDLEKVLISDTNNIHVMAVFSKLKISSIH